MICRGVFRAWTDAAPTPSEFLKNMMFYYKSLAKYNETCQDEIQKEQEKIFRFKQTFTYRKCVISQKNLITISAKLPSYTGLFLISWYFKCIPFMIKWKTLFNTYYKYAKKWILKCVRLAGRRGALEWENNFKFAVYFDIIYYLFRYLLLCNFLCFI